MSQNPKFTQEKCIKIADDLFYKNTGRHLEDWKTELLKCFWNNMKYKEITEYLRSKKNIYYSESYLSRNLGPDLMKELSKALGEPVNKKNFKQAFKQKWKRDTRANISQHQMPINRIISFLHDAIRNKQTYAQGIENVKRSLEYIGKTKYLKDLEVEVLRGTWDNKTYDDIADDIERSPDYIRKDIGAELWKKVSAILGIKITKRNFKAVFKQWQKNMKLNLV